MDVIIPIVYKEQNTLERKAFLYKVVARVRPGIDGIEINQDPELIKFQDLVKELFGDNNHIEVNISPIDKTVKRIEYITDENMPSMTLGIFVAIENQINNRTFIDNYDLLIITGDVINNRLKPIDDEEKKFDAVSKYLRLIDNQNKKAKFIYVKNTRTLKSGKHKNIETIRIHGNTKYEDFMDSIFSITGDTVEYYTTYVDKDGIPYGINRLTKSEVSNTQMSYKFISKNNRLIRVEHINSKGWPCTYSGPKEDPVIQDITYPDDNTIKIKCKTLAGKIEYIKELKPYPRNGNFNRINFLSADESYGFYLNKNSLDYFSSISSNVCSSKAQIRGYVLERNREGFITKKRFVRYQGSLDFQSDENGISGFEYVLDTKGLPIKKFYIDNNENKIETHLGIGGISFSYDEKGNLVKQSFINSEGNFVNQKGIGKIKYLRDDSGNVVEESFFDKDDKEVVCIEGYHKIKNFYKNGQILESIFYDKYNKETNSVNGFSKYKGKYNEKGYEIEISFFDKKGKPALGTVDNRLFSTVQYEYDERGLKIENRYFDTDGKPYKGQTGTEVIKYKYDINGNIIEDLYFNSEGNLEEDDENTAKLEILYDEFDRKIAELCYGADEKLKVTRSGYAIGKYSYDDETGNISSIAFYDENKKPVNPIKYGFYKKIVEYNNEGLEKEIRLYKNDGELVEGICKYTYEYDGKGFITNLQTYDKDNKLKNNDEGYAITKFQKENSNEYYEFIDENNNFVIKKELGYDNRDNLNKIKIYRGNEKKFIKCIKRNYDDFGNIIEEFYTDESEVLLINDTNGYAKQVFQYDERGNLTVRMFYSNDNKPFEYKGYSRIVNKFDNKGNIIERYAYKKNDSPFEIQDSVYGFKYIYNSKNLPIECLYLGKDKKTIKGDSSGICAIHIDYTNDSECNLRYLDLHKSIVLSKKVTYIIEEDDEKRKIFFKDKTSTWVLVLHE